MNRLVTWLCIILVVVLFAFVVLPQAVRWRIRSFFQEKYEADVDYKSVRWANEGLVFSDVSVQSKKEDPLQFALKAAEITLSYQLRPIDRQLELDVAINQPQINITKQSPSVIPLHYLQDKLQKVSADSSLLFSIAKSSGMHLLHSIIHLRAYEGTVHVDDMSHTFNMTSTFGSVEDVKDQWDLSIDDQLFIDFEKGPNLFAHLKLQDVDIAALTREGQFFLGPAADAWVIKEGRVSAEFEVASTFVSGSGKITNLSLEHGLHGIQGSIPELTIVASQRESESPSTNVLWREILQGSEIKVMLSKQAFFNRSTEGTLAWAVKDIQGYIALNTPTVAGVQADFNGQFLFENQGTTPCSLQGSMPITLDGGKGVLLLSPVRVEVSVTEGKAIDLICENIGPREYELARNLIPKWAFIWEETKFLRGSISAHLKAALDENRTFSQFSVEQIDGKHLWFSSKNLHIDGYIEHLKGNMEFAIRASQGSLKPRNGQLSLTRGDLYWDRRNEYDEASLERLMNLNCSMTIKDGILQNGQFTGNLAGMQAELKFLGLQSEIVAHMQLKGKASYLLSHIPYDVATELSSFIGNEEITWSGDLMRQGTGLHLTSKLGTQTTVLDLDAFLQRLPKEEWELLPVKWQRWGVALMEKEASTLLPFQRKNSSHVLRVNWLKDNEGSWGITLKQGTIQSDDLPLKPYLSPFVFPHQGGEIQGSVKFTGDFNDRSMLVHFQVKDFVVDNQYLNIRIDEVGYVTSQEYKLSDPASFVYFDFQDETSYGFIPVKKGSYLDKENGMFFEEVEALVSLSKNRVQLSQIRTKADGVLFKGSADLDISKEQLVLHVHANEVEGDVPQVQKFCSHFSKNELWDFPLYGRLTTDDEGVSIEGTIPLNDTPSHFTWKVEGQLASGSYTAEKYASQFQDLSLHFFYDSAAHALSIDDVAGDLLVANVDHYHMVLPTLKLNLAQLSVFDFDISLECDGMQCIRLNGAVAPFGEGLLTLSLNQNESHIGGIYPYIETFVFQDFTRIIALKAKPHIYLENAVEDLKRVVRTGIFPFSVDQMDGLVRLPLEGEIDGTISLESGVFACDFEGSSVTRGGKPLEKCSFKAEGALGVWKITELQLGTFALEAVLRNDANHVTIETLHASDAGIQLDAEGSFVKAQRLLSIDVKECVVTLGELKLAQHTKTLAQLWRPQGKVFINGLFKADLKNSAEPVMTFTGISALEGIELRGNRIQNQGSIPLTYSSEEGIRIEGLVLNIRQKDQYQYKASFSLRRAHYDFEEETFHLDGLGFSLSSVYLKELLLLCQEFFPDLIDDSTVSFLKDMKSDGGGLQGHLNIQMSPEVVFIGVRLKDGRYTILGKEYDLKKISIDYSPTYIAVTAQYQWQEMPLQLMLRAERPDIDHGIFSLKTKGNETYPLTFMWERDSEEGILIKKVDGALAGITINCVAKAPYVLSGRISLQDVAALRPALPKEWRALLDSWKIGRGYTLNGDFYLPKEGQEAGFNGILEGKDFTLLGFELDQLKADVSANASKVVITNFGLTDKYGVLMAPSITLMRDPQTNWHVAFPLVRLSEFRPAGLFKISKSLKNLVIHTAELKDFSGILGNTATFKGGGFFTFEKVVKNTLGNLLLSIPADILGRIGLSTSVLNPASGTVNFSVSNRRVYITKLKDVYSEGKKSRFYLPKSPVQSYIDFDGYLNLYIRIKQYNLLLKLTEALRIHIQGKWDNPSFSFEKNSTPIAV